MSKSTTDIKRCGKKEQCVHPEQVDGGWLPKAKEYFYSDKSSDDGFYHNCKACESKRKAKWYEENTEVANIRSAQWSENNPGRINELSRRWYAENTEHHHELSHNWYLENTERRRELDDEWRKNNPEKAREIGARSHRNHPETGRTVARNRRAQKKGSAGIHTKEEIQIQYNFQNSRCYYCNAPLGDKYHADHVIPLVKGGGNDISNIVCACPACNLSKNDLLLEEWLSRITDPALYNNVQLRIEERAELQ